MENSYNLYTFKNPRIEDWQITILFSKKQKSFHYSPGKQVHSKNVDSSKLFSFFEKQVPQKARLQHPEDDYYYYILVYKKSAPEKVFFWLHLLGSNDNIFEVIIDLNDSYNLMGLSRYGILYKKLSIDWNALYDDNDAIANEIVNTAIDQLKNRRSEQIQSASELASILNSLIKMDSLPKKSQWDDQVESLIKSFRNYLKQDCLTYLELFNKVKHNIENVQFDDYLIFILPLWIIIEKELERIFAEQSLSSNINKLENSIAGETNTIRLITELNDIKKDRNKFIKLEPLPSFLSPKGISVDKYTSQCINTVSKLLSLVAPFYK